MHHAPVVVVHLQAQLVEARYDRRAAGPSGAPSSARRRQLPSGPVFSKKLREICRSTRSSLKRVAILNASMALFTSEAVAIDDAEVVRVELGSGLPAFVVERRRSILVNARSSCFQSCAGEILLMRSKAFEEAGLRSEPR